MKDILLAIFTMPILPIIVSILGYLSSVQKIKLRFYSLSFAIFFFTSLPITSYILSYPLTSLSDNFQDNNFSNAQSIIVLTGGIKKNIIGKWIPNNETQRRVEIAKKISQEYSLPIIISGGKTTNKNQSEAFISKKYFNLTNIFMEEKSLNTYQSAMNLKKYCLEDESTILLISGMYHSLRSFLTFKSNKCNIKVFKYERKFSYNLFIPSLSGLSNFNQFVYEISGLFYYIITNKIKIF